MRVVLDAQTAAAPQPWVPTPPTRGMIRLTATRNQDGSTRAFEITNARAMSLPHWNPDIETPPLDAVEATRIGRTWLSG